MAEKKAKKVEKSKAEKKEDYFGKLSVLLEEYQRILIVEATNVGSSQMQSIRKLLRGKAVMLMGKNTLIRKSIRGHLEKNPNLESLLAHVRGNVGFVFTKGDLAEVKTKVASLRVEAPAKVGATAPNDVIVPAGPTGLEPTQTSFLQALNIPSKINKGQVEIQQDHLLMKQGDKVGQSEAALLSKLNIKPFTYGLTVVMVYENGSVYEPHVLDLSEADIVEKFLNGVRNVTALVTELHLPAKIAVPHVLLNGYRNVLAIAFGTAFSFPRAEQLKSAIASGPAHPPPAADKGGEKEEKKGGGKEKEAKKPAAEEKKPAVEEKPAEEEEALGLDLFG